MRDVSNLQAGYERIHGKDRSDEAQNRVLLNLSQVWDKLMISGVYLTRLLIQLVI